MILAEVWAKNWAKLSGHFRASFAVQNALRALEALPYNDL